MASLEGDVMRSFALVCEVIKDRVMSDIQSAAVNRKILAEDSDPGDNLKAIDAIVRSSVQTTVINASRQMQSSIKPYARELDMLRSEAKRKRK